MPEGKGVSSSAAVEVATMSAIAAAHGTCAICICICFVIPIKHLLLIPEEHELLPRDDEMINSD